jgi:hypothetical protein
MVLLSTAASEPYYQQQCDESRYSSAAQTSRFSRDQISLDTLGLEGSPPPLVISVTLACDYSREARDQEISAALASFFSATSR